MYTLSTIPNAANVVKGDLGRGEGVVGVMSGRTRISLHKGSLMALQAHHDGKFGEMKVCFASSADTPLAEKIGRGKFEARGSRWVTTCCIVWSHKRQPLKNELNLNSCFEVT